MPAGGDKGRYLKDFLEVSAIPARNLIFVDDKPRNVQSVDSAFTGSRWNHIEFRYGAADERVQSFDPRLADFQWGYFKQHQVFLSDQEAYWMMEDEAAHRIRSSCSQAIAEKGCDGAVGNPLHP